MFLQDACPQNEKIVAHAYTAVSCAAAIYADATMGDTTEEAAMVKLHEVIMGDVQYEFTLRGKGVAMKEDASHTANFRVGIEVLTTEGGKNEFLKWGV